MNFLRRHVSAWLRRRMARKSVKYTLHADRLAIHMMMAGTRRPV